MNLFGESNQERAVQTLIHDTNGELGEMDSTVFLLIKYLKEGKLTNEELEKRLNSLLDCKKDLIKVIDAYYNKFKNDFNDK